MERLLSRNRSQQALGRCSLRRLPFALCLVACVLLAEQASSQTVHSPVYLHSGAYHPGTHVPQATPIPGQMMQQALAYGAPVNYQHRWVAAGETDGIEPVPTDGEVVDEAGFFEEAWDPMGWVRVWANGVPPRIITVQRYSDAYWRFNVDLLSLERYGPRETITTTGSLVPVDIFKRGATTGGMRLSASADLFYSFDLEFAWLGDITWAGRPTNEFDWNVVNNGAGHNYANQLGGTFNGVRINPVGNKTNFSSTLNAFEMNTRFRWVGTTAPVTGAWIFGVRYVRFTEYAYVNSGQNRIQVNLPAPETRTNTAASVRTEAENNLVGFQSGGEWFWSVFRGVMIGGNLKGGIYGNLSTNKSTIYDLVRTNDSQSLGNPGYEFRDTTAAFFGEANVMVNAHLGHNWYIRGGYTGLFLTNVSTAVSAVQEDNEVVSTNNSLIASGFYGGLEWQY